MVAAKEILATGFRRLRWLQMLLLLKSRDSVKFRLLLAWIFFGLPFARAVTVEIADPAEFSRIINPHAALTTHATIDKWLEGPTWVPSGGGYLVFCDQGNNRLKKLVPPTGLTDFLLPLANTLINGTVLDGQERLICAEAGSAGQKISRLVSGVTTPLVTRCNDLKFYSPNDVAVKSDGTIWFTDPNYNSGTVKGTSGYAAGYYVYQFNPTIGNSSCRTVITSGPIRPNGICFSPDETKLYVADSDGGASGHRIYVYAVSATNTLSGGTVFANISNGSPDGIKCDIDGRVWSSAGNGVHIFAPDGHLIGKILVNRTANVCFGGPQYKTLFMTGQPLVTSMPVLVAGTQALKKLEIKNQSGQLVLSWPAPSTGWSLQETTQFETPGSWINSSLQVVITNNQNTANMTTTASSKKFFRLRLN